MRQVLDEFCGLINPLTDEMMEERNRLEGSLYEFSKAAWPIVEPGVAWKDGYVVRAECEHLEAVYSGEIKKLILNIPPRHGKSIRLCVMFFAWVWAKSPMRRFIYATYSDMLSKRDSIRSRDVIQHEWFQRLWGHKFRLKLDRNTQHVFENTQRGFRFATTPGGVATGEGAEFIIADDIISVEGGRSKAELELSYRFWTQTLGSRFNDPLNVARVVSMQRINRGDLSGRLIDQMADYETFIMPFEYEPQRYWLPDPANPKKIDGRPKDYITPTKLQQAKPHLLDPRKKPGEILWPERFPTKEVIDDVKNSVGAGVPGQLQQRPAPAGGATLRAENIKLCYETWEGDELYILLGETTEGIKPQRVAVDKMMWFQTADTAQTEDQQNDPTAVAHCGMTPQGDLVVYYIFNEHLEYPDQWPALMELRQGQAEWDHSERRWSVPGAASPWPKGIAWQGVEPKSTGESLIQTARRAGLPLRRLNVYSGDKMQRGSALVTLAQNGKLYFLARMKQRTEAEAQLTEFPNSTHDDIWDVLSYAASEIQVMMTTAYTGAVVHNLGVHKEIEEAKATEAKNIPDVLKPRPLTDKLLDAEPKAVVDDMDDLRALLGGLEQRHAQEAAKVQRPSLPHLDDYD